MNNRLISSSKALSLPLVSIPWNITFRFFVFICHAFGTPLSSSLFLVQVLLHPYLYQQTCCIRSRQCPVKSHHPFTCMSFLFF